MGVSFPALRPEQRLSCLFFKKKSSWTYVALKNSETFWLLRNRRQDTCLLRTSTKMHASPSCKQADRASAAQLQPADHHECRKRTSDPACALGGGNFFNECGNVWHLIRFLLRVSVKLQPNHVKQLQQCKSVNGIMSSKK